MVASVVINATNKNKLDDFYDIFLNIEPKVTIENEARIQLKMTNNKFLFNGDTCSSVEKIIANGSSNYINNNSFLA